MSLPILLFTLVILYSHQVYPCVSFAYPVWIKNKKEKIPWLKSKKKTGPKKKKVFDEGWRKTLAETDKSSWFNKSSLDKLGVRRR